ncbi:2,4'-dihydroxyacetophenone dioxygenase family protein [Henriciella litoralis]|uniref:2,4'-dihydroxyacetophenone dioxygenase family protein n=1 Tax=Henriciella litoralis TaxID=568102 RepID=UPI0009FD3A92|nr:2,4'-dihydroxyacetophenone dioxygenase family protein [Henriciella litoralis]
MREEEELLYNPKDLKWHSLGNGAHYRLLRVSPETGHFSIILKLDAGGMFAGHYHLGAGEFLMLKGELKYKDSTAKAGDWGYEPLGAVHADTNVEMETELLFIGYGPIAFTGEDGSIAQILDAKLLSDVAEGKIQPVSFTVDA